jgi:RimJ/RimL family protein N-acetyltransferase
MSNSDSPSLAGFVRLRDVADGDLPILYEHQRDPDATRMAAFPARDWDAFTAHWAKIRSDPALITRAVLVDGRVAGSIGCWEKDGTPLVGYWIGKEYWGRGVATAALAALLGEVEVRPLYAYVAKHNVGSIRVLEKCGFAVCPEATDALEGSTDSVEEWVYRLGAADRVE